MPGVVGWAWAVVEGSEILTGSFDWGVTESGLVAADESPVTGLVTEPGPDVGDAADSTESGGVASGFTGSGPPPEQATAISNTSAVIKT